MNTSHYTKHFLSIISTSIFHEELDFFIWRGQTLTKLNLLINAQAKQFSNCAATCKLETPTIQKKCQEDVAFRDGIKHEKN